MAFPGGRNRRRILNDENIDIGQIDVNSFPKKKFPSAPTFRIVISRRAHEAVWQHARGSLNQSREDATKIVEVGGILIGDVYKDENGPFLEITGAIVARHTKNEGTQMTFTPETWMHLNDVKSKKYPDARIVGWYHTHPRFGIFLSDMDKFIHKHHFPQPWTTALVVDPVQESEGFFVWSVGEPIPAGEYWVGGERREGSRTSQAQPVKTSEPKAAPQAAESPLAQSIFALSLAVCFAGLLFLFWIAFSREAAHSDAEKVVLEALNEQGATLQRSAQALMALENQLALPQGGQSDPQLQRRLLQIAEGGFQKAALIGALAQAKLSNRQDLLDQIQAELSGAKQDGEKQNGQKQDVGAPNADKQNISDPNAGKQNAQSNTPAGNNGKDTTKQGSAGPGSSKQAEEKSTNGKQDSEKQGADKNTENQKKGSGEVKKK